VISSKKANKKKSKKNGSDNEDEEAEGTTAGTVVTVALLVAPNKVPPMPVKKVKGKGEELERVFKLNCRMCLSVHFFTCVLLLSII
jgi:hypothetical protein